MKITNINSIKLNGAYTDKKLFANEIFRGLKAKKKTISSKYFYDDAGSKLFQKISLHKDYYPTRKEIEILNNNKFSLPKIINKTEIDIIELGPGDGSKSKIIIDGFLDSNYNVNYYPIDISKQALSFLKNKIKPNKKLSLHGIDGEYISGLKFLKNTTKNSKLVLFLGSNIGNLKKKQSEIFLKNIKKNINFNDFLLMGFDLKKSIKILTKAYNDSDKLTKKFNLNLLKRINKELNGNFKLNRFDHNGIYNPTLGAMESYIISKENQKVHIKNLNYTFEFKVSEPIHVEYSFKYSKEDISNLCFKTGFKSVKNFYDSKNYFTDALWSYKSNSSAL